MELLALWVVSVMGCGVCGWVMGGLVPVDICQPNRAGQTSSSLKANPGVRDGHCRDSHRIGIRSALYR